MTKVIYKLPLSKCILTSIFTFIFLNISFSQDVNSNRKYYYRVIYEVSTHMDKSMTCFLDSLNRKALKGLSLEVLPNFCKENFVSKYLIFRFVPDLVTDDTICYLKHFFRFVNQFYFSADKRYKIPVTFGDLAKIVNDNCNEYPLLKSDSGIIFIRMFKVNTSGIIVGSYGKIPEWALRSKYK